ncbi:MAG: cell division topological specificity factor MinE [Oligoflexia bacterium]|nr:cell division topological specificity factor MinE [Oligoflexia bacterium]
MFNGLRNFFSNKAASKSIARSRLHFVLVQDRTGLTNEEMASFKSEMCSVIEKYFVIDKQGFDIEYKRETEMTTLVINSPIVVRRQEGQKHSAGSKHKHKQNQNNKAQTEESSDPQPVVAG